MWKHLNKYGEVYETKMSNSIQHTFKEVLHREHHVEQKKIVVFS